MSGTAAPNPTEPSRAVPRLSVVMPVHNALPYLDAAVESILDQSFRDFEFVILDDASTDGSTQRLREWAARDDRIRLIEGERNLGPARSSDLVARLALAPIVARMDADDISYRERLREQLRVLESRSDVGLVGTLSDIIDERGRKIRGPEAWRLHRHSALVPFAHGSIMYRMRIFEKVGGYRRQCDYWEDQDLIARIASATKVAIIPHPLYQVRQSPSSTRVAAGPARLGEAVDQMYRAVERIAQSRSYDDVLEDTPNNDRRLDPRAFISAGSVILWAGQRPRLLRLFFRRGKLSADFQTLSASVWVTWASLNPRSLRLFLRLLLAIRNWLASRSYEPEELVMWSPGETCPASRTAAYCPPASPVGKPRRFSNARTSGSRPRN